MLKTFAIFRFLIEVRHNKINSYTKTLIKESADDVKNWLRLAWCLNIWDLDSRAHYHGVTFIHFKKTPLLLIGDPWSQFSQKPEHINALLIKDNIPAGLGKQRN